MWKKSSKNHPKVISKANQSFLKSPKSHPKVIQMSSKSHPNIIHKSSKSHPSHPKVLQLHHFLYTVDSNVLAVAMSATSNKNQESPESTEAFFLICMVYIPLEVVYFSSHFLYYCDFEFWAGMQIITNNWEVQIKTYKFSFSKSPCFNWTFSSLFLMVWNSHWDFLPKFLSLHYYTTLEVVLGV